MKDEPEVELIESTSEIIDLDQPPKEDESTREIQYPSWLIFMVDHEGKEIIVDQSP